MGSDLGLGRRASWAVHGIGAWVVHGCMGAGVFGLVRGNFLLEGVVTGGSLK